MNVVLVGSPSESGALAERLACAGSTPVAVGCSLPTPLPDDALVVAAVTGDVLPQICAAVGAAAPVLALIESQDARAHAAAIDAGADDCLWIGAESATLAARLAVLGRRRQTASLHARAEADYRAIVEGTSDALFIIDVTPEDDFRVRFVNSYHERLLGQRNEAIAGKLLQDIFSPARFDEITRRYRRVIESRLPLMFEEKVSPGGRETTVQTRLTPLLDASGRCYGMIGSTRDITAAKEAELAHQRAEERLTAAVDQAPILVSTFDADGRYTFSRGAALRLVGRASDEKVGMHYSSYYTPGGPACLALERALKGEASSLDAVLQTGETLHLAYSPWLSPSGELVGAMVVGIDVTARVQAEEARLRSEADYRAVVEGTSDTLYAPTHEANDDSRTTLVNASYMQLLDRRPEDVIGKSVRDRRDQAAAERILGHYAEAIRSRSAVSWEWTDTIRGESVTGTALVTPLFNEDGECYRLIGTMRDVTKQKRAEQERLRSEANYRAVVEGTSDGIYVMERGDDGEFRCTVVNEAYERLFERPAAVVLGKTLHESLPPENAARVAAHYADAIAAGGPIEWEATFPVTDGERTLVIHITPLFDAEGECYRIIGSMRDVTASRRAEEGRRNAEQFLRTLVDKAPVIVLALDAEGRFTFTAGAAVENLGLPPERAVGRSALHIYRDFPRVTTAIEGALSGQSTTVEIEASGRTWDAHYTALVDGDGHVNGAVGVILDVTERKRAEATLVTERAFTDATIDSLPGVFYLFTAAGRFLKTNARFKQVSGYSADEVAEMHPLDFFVAGEQAAVAEGISQVFARGESTVEAGFVAKDGTSTPYFFTGKLIQFGGETCLVGMGIDVSEGKLAEEAVRRAAADLGAVFASVRDQITLVGIDGRVLSFNPAANRAAEAVAGHGMAAGDDMNEYLLPDDGERFREQFALALDGQSASTEQSVEIEGRTFWYERVYSPVRLEDGSIRGVVVVARNITNRKRSEEALRESQKLESLGILAGGIAHDFNNLLVGILGNAGLALEEVSPSSPVRATLEDIETAGKRAADLARQMLAYSGKGRFVVQLVDLGGLVDEMMHLLRVSIGKRVVLNCAFGEGLPAVEADATQLRQVIMNLVVNASDAIGDDEGVISVATGVVHVDRTYLEEAYLSPDLPEGDYVYLDVSDTGCGMDARTQARIFDPFFTTKFTGRGLGLAAVLGIVRGHRGAIKVTSEPGEGTSFRLLLPVAEGAVDTAGAGAPQKWTGSGTVLLADDESTVRAVTARALGSFGFEVLEAEDGQDALETFQANAERIVCVLLDMTMPRLNGEEAFLAIKAIRPEVPVVLMSGYSEQEAMAHFKASGLAGFVQKPYSVADLRETLRDVTTGA